MTTRTPCDDVRGVAGHRSRVYPANDADFDRLAMSHGVPVPWNYEPYFDEGQDPYERIVGFLHRFATISGDDRDIVFARLIRMSFEDIGIIYLGGIPAAEAEKYFNNLLEQFEELVHAFRPDRKSKDPFYKIVTFLHRMARESRTDREIFFARIMNQSWMEIAHKHLRKYEDEKAKPQAAEKRFAAMVAKFPELGRAFPESKRQTKTTKG